MREALGERVEASWTRKTRKNRKRKSKTGQEKPEEGRDYWV